MEPPVRSDIVRPKGIVLSVMDFKDRKRLTPNGSKTGKLLYTFPAGRPKMAIPVYPTKEVGRMRVNMTLAGKLAVLVMAFFVTTGVTLADGSTVRWDIVTVSPGPPVTINGGGTASPKAADSYKITVTGSGTFGENVGTFGDDDVTGGGTWETFNSTGAMTGAGTYWVTRVVHFEKAPGSLPFPHVDNIGSVSQEAAGLVVLAIAFSDGSKGTITISCTLVGTPPTNVEGVTVVKGSVHYWSISGATLFHIRPHTDD